MTRWLAALLLLAVWAAPPGVGAQPWDPTATVAAYSTALNAHDLSAALALFDQYGSATDAHGHHFEGRAGLTTFLLANGFGGPDAHISTERLHVVANRAVWTYTCSCASGSTDVRIVLRDQKISVFAITPPASPPFLPPPRADTVVLLWLVGLGLVVGTLAASLGLRRRHLATPSPRLPQGRLLAALLHAYQNRHSAAVD